MTRLTLVDVENGRQLWTDYAGCLAESTKV